MEKVVCVLSGGMDSAVILALVRRLGCEVQAISFNYGQRHGTRELEAASRLAVFYGVKHHVVDITAVRSLLSGSSLTDDVPVPHGHYTEAAMKVTVVPNRNAIMLAIAWGLAVSTGSDAVACGIHAGDHAIYPDCRPEFVEAFNRAAPIGTAGLGNPDLRLVAPFVHLWKTDIALLGEVLAVPFRLTWSCYQGGERHCGRCGTCVERREAFALAGIADPTEYQFNEALPAAPESFAVEPQQASLRALGMAEVLKALDAHELQPSAALDRARKIAITTA